MNKVIIAIMLLCAGAYAQSTDEEFPADEDLLLDEELLIDEEPSFEQVSEHCYSLHIPESGENIAVVATMQGILLFDPPPEPDLTILIESLESLSAGPVKWMINTGNYFLRTAGVEYFSGKEAVLLAGYRQYASPADSGVPLAVPGDDAGSDVFEDPNASTTPVSDWTEDLPAFSGRMRRDSPDFPRFTFKDRMYIYPDNLEIQIQALPHEARTGADIFTYVPEEKVLFTGRLFEPAYYPDIDVSAGGSALKWIDALEQTINFVPLLISAIPEEPEEEEESEENGEETVEDEQASVLEEGDVEGEGLLEEEEEEEPVLEELIAVIPARGEVANLLMMKDLLDTARQLQRGISRALKSGRSCEDYLDSPDSYLFQTYGNYFPFATQLCREISLEMGVKQKESGARSKE